MLTLKLWVKKEMVSRTIRHTSVAILPSNNAWCTISASEVPASVDREKIRRKQCSTLQLPKNLSADIDKVLPLHFTAFGRWCKNSKMLNLPIPFREAASAWCHRRKTVPVLHLSITVFKARQSMRCPSCLQRGEMAKCFKGTKCTHMERLRADPRSLCSAVLLVALFSTQTKVLPVVKHPPPPRGHLCVRKEFQPTLRHVRKFN